MWYRVECHCSLSSGGPASFPTHPLVAKLLAPLRGEVACHASPSLGINVWHVDNGLTHFTGLGTPAPSDDMTPSDIGVGAAPAERLASPSGVRRQMSPVQITLSSITNEGQALPGVARGHCWATPALPHAEVGGGVHHLLVVPSIPTPAERTSQSLTLELVRVTPNSTLPMPSQPALMNPSHSRLLLAVPEPITEHPMPSGVGDLHSVPIWNKYTTGSIKQQVDPPLAAVLKALPNTDG